MLKILSIPEKLLGRSLSIYRMYCEHTSHGMNSCYPFQKSQRFKFMPEGRTAQQDGPLTHKMAICRSIVSHSKKMNSTTVFQSIAAGHYILPILLVKAFQLLRLTDKIIGISLLKYLPFRYTITNSANTLNSMTMSGSTGRQYIFSKSNPGIGKLVYGRQNDKK